MAAPLRDAAPLPFATYTPCERAADQIVHGIGVPLGLACAIVLLVRVASTGHPPLLLPIAIYGLCMIGMLTASAAYQVSAPGPRKERLRVFDRAMIFAMIAGTYTPFSVTVLRQHGGLWLCALAWLLAAIGIAVTLIFPRRFERVLLAFYLALGWMVLGLIKVCAMVLLPTPFWLIVAGGVVYTLGAAVHALDRLRFHNPIWHALVLCAAGLHYAAISLQLTGGVL